MLPLFFFLALADADSSPFQKHEMRYLRDMMKSIIYLVLMPLDSIGSGHAG